MSEQFVNTRPNGSAAPSAKGHYSLCVAAGGLIWVSGLVGNSGLHDQGAGADGTHAQALAALAKLDRVLADAGAHLTDVVMTTAYISDASHWDAVDRAYASAFGKHKPARAIIPSAPFLDDVMIEITAVAIAPGRNHA